MAKITAIVLTKNEEKNIKDCLSSLAWCSEILLIDDYSTDNTVAIAEKFGARTIKRNLNGSFASQRNYALEKAKNNWILFVDADERVSDSLAYEIKKAILNENNSGYYISRNTVFLAKEMKGGEWSGTKLLRIGKKNSGLWTRAVHETWEISGTVKLLKSPLLHLSPTSLDKMISSMALYSPLHARSRVSENKDVKYFQIIIYPVVKFFNNFFVKRGYVDGVHGFVYSTLMSLHSFMSLAIQWIEKKS